MKLLVLFACIAVASAYSSFYPGFYEHKYPVDYYKKDYPVYEHEYPWYHKYSKDYPVYEHYGKQFPWYHKDFPVYEKSYKYPYYYNMMHKDVPYYGKYYKDYPVYDKYYHDFPVHHEYYKDFPMYEKMFKDFNFAEFFGEKDFTYVKKDFIIFYYKYLVELIDLFKVRFGDYLIHYETFKFDEYYFPTKCQKMSGLMHWMYTTNVDVVKYHEHFFDYFMMCKMVDYVKFIKNYFLHFSTDIMYKDFELIKGLYGMLGHHGYGVHKYYHDTFSPYYYNYGYETKFLPYEKDYHLY